jgi:PTS system nitrogen regulatory IIA component
MPYEQMSERQAATYLHMDVREVVKLAARGQLPCRKVAGRFVFHKGDLDHWVETKMPDLDGNRLADIEKAVRAHHGMIEGEELVVWPLIPRKGLAVPLEARTRDSVIRELVDLAVRNDVVCARDKLIEEVRKREELCPTAVAPGIAMPHPRRPVPYDISQSFVIVGLTASGIPFGAEDGLLTRLFFLICCKDERTHLHVLARLARMLYDSSAAEKLLASTNAAELGELLLGREKAVLAED